MRMARRKPRFHAALCVILSVVLFFVGSGVGVYLYLDGHKPQSDAVVASGDVSIHFLELGNAYTGDCTYIKAGDVDILIDAGSRTSSVDTIAAYLDRYVEDGVLEYVIVTHAHQDHYAGFATNESTESLLDKYRVGTLIDFSMTNQEEKGMYANYLRERSEAVARGTTHYTAQECIDSENTVFDLGSDIIMTILDSYYYDHKSTSGENDYSVCMLLSQGDHHFLFTGDLEEDGEGHLVEMNNLPQVDVYKAGHHGSKTSSSTRLMAVIQPEIVCVCCCCGSAEYTEKDENQFPTQAFIDRVAPYTKQVYVTTICVDWDKKTFASMNGNITVTSSGGTVTVHGSANDTLLLDTEWFRQHRKRPLDWAA